MLKKINKLINSLKNNLKNIYEKYYIYGNLGNIWKLNKYENFKSKDKIIWGRWCLPTYNPNCNQSLKGSLADYDNNLCDGLPLYKVKQTYKNYNYKNYNYKN